MSRLHLIRHGQAMFLTDNYDRLSPLGTDQARRVGLTLDAEDALPQRYLVGTLQRQQQTLDAMVDAANGVAAPVVRDIAFNEFPFEAMMEQQIGRLKGSSDAVDRALIDFQQAEDRAVQIRAVQRLLEFCIEDWVENDRSDPAANIPTWEAFCTRVGRAIAELQHKAASGSHIAVVSSGGVVAAVVAHVLGAPPIAAARLCWRVNNASITQLTFSKSRISLDHFNRVDHLPIAARTYR
ncbi:MAG: histidine phosphatase family protein [Pseudomonadota bacterium]